MNIVSYYQYNVIKKEHTGEGESVGVDEQFSGAILLPDLLFFAKRIARRSDRADFLCLFSMIFWARDDL